MGAKYETHVGYMQGKHFTLYYCSETAKELSQDTKKKSQQKIQLVTVANSN